MQNAQSVYAYAVCLLTVVCGMVTAGLFAFDALKVVAPAFTLNSYERQTLSSNLDFRNSYEFKNTPVPKDDAAVTKMREERLQMLIRLEPQKGRQGMAFEGIILLIDALVFAIHWRLRRAGDIHTAAA